MDRRRLWPSASTSGAFAPRPDRRLVRAGRQGHLGSARPRSPRLQGELDRAGGPPRRRRDHRLRCPARCRHNGPSRRGQSDRNPLRPAAAGAAGGGSHGFRSPVTPARPESAQIIAFESAKRRAKDIAADLDPAAAWPDPASGRRAGADDPGCLPAGRCRGGVRQWRLQRAGTGRRIPILPAAAGTEQGHRPNRYLGASPTCGRTLCSCPCRTLPPSSIC